MRVLAVSTGRRGVGFLPFCRFWGSRTDIECTCGYRFCALCSMEAHAPATCEQASAWRTLMSSATEKPSVKMMMDNYKRCPSCKIFIEKNRGCRHMTCQNPACNYEVWCCCMRKRMGRRDCCTSLQRGRQKLLFTAVTARCDAVLLVLQGAVAEVRPRVQGLQRRQPAAGAQVERA